jgi:hypothetical protein
MRLLRSALLLSVTATAAGLGAGSALAGGNAGPPLYPTSVNVQMVQTETMLGKAADYVDAADSTNAVKAVNAAKSHMRKAWLAAKYLVDNAPPPVAGDSAVSPAKAKKKMQPATHRKAENRAHKSGGAVAGASPFADSVMTAAGVLNLQHDVAAGMLGILENADATLLPVVSSTLFAALGDRDTAIAYIHSIAPPPVAGDGRVKARSSGGAIASTWDSVMPGVVPYVEDELTAIDSLRARVKLSPGRGRVLDAAELLDTKTERTINKYWPPVPPAG